MEEVLNKEQERDRDRDREFSVNWEEISTAATGGENLSAFQDTVLLRLKEGSAMEQRRTGKEGREPSVIRVS